MDYLLDTCTFLWYAQQPSMLSAAAVTALNDPASELFVSDASLWEISLKHSAGKLPLPDAPRTWIPQKLAYHRLQSLSVTHDAIFRSGELPRVHADPFDRLIAAQALDSALTILSPDVPLSLLGAARIW
jgi:PIN domain nuclease of toxin-antitoxin system